MQKPMVTGVVSTLRSCLKNSLLDNLVDSFGSYDDLLEFIYKRGGDHRISNSEALLLAALYGAKESGSDTQILGLNTHFDLIHSEPVYPEVLQTFFEQSRGLVLSSPVYFGDRSSLVADLIKFYQNRNRDHMLPLDGKAVGSISVGAKRNGGQETTNIYGLYDCLNLGACVVGNGPPTSQYGGTGWGGGLGAIIDDNFGLNTSKGTGHRVALLSKVLSFQTDTMPIKILFVVTRADTHGRFIEGIKSLPFTSDVAIDILDLSPLKIKRCLACPICPNGNLDQAYTCVIPPLSKKEKGDDMATIHERLLSADGIVIAHYSGADAGPDRFQVFMERTRFIRRHDFELADRAFCAYTVTDDLTNIYPLRFMTSFLRHNLFIVGPFYTRLQDANRDIAAENISESDFAKRFENAAKKSKIGIRSQISDVKSVYEPIGYPENAKKES